MGENKTEKSNDSEKVDGPLIAARILRRMPIHQRSKILDEMRNQNEALALLVQERVFNIAELSNLSAKNTQALVREITHEDLALSIKSAPPQVKEHLLQNMSDRKRELVIEETALSKELSGSKVQEAQWRILEKLEELRERGLIKETKILALG